MKITASALFAAGNAVLGYVTEVQNGQTSEILACAANINWKSPRSNPNFLFKTTECSQKSENMETFL